MDQHANAFSETLPRTVVQDIEQNILAGIVTKSFKGPDTRPGTATEIGTRPVIDDHRIKKAKASSVKRESTKGLDH